MLVVGEFHGVRETPGVLYSLASACKTRAVAFEWSHEEMNESVQDFVRSGSFDFDRLWALPTGAEFFSGDGRITAGHFALLKRLRDEGRLDQVIAFDRLDPEPEPPSVYSLCRRTSLATGLDFSPRCSTTPSGSAGRAARSTMFRGRCR